MVLPVTRPTPFACRLKGTLGEFRTTAGPVQYLLTKAKVSLAPDEDALLANQLRLVREVLDVKHLPFDQLLQRDLDDHRVASKLIPYLLTQSSSIPPFFPPILAMVLPIEHSEPDAEFGEPREHFPNASAEVAVEEDGALWLERRFGSALRLRRLAENPTTPSTRYPIGEVAWEPSDAALVVLDGQHRAMALLAIHRHMNPTAVPESFRRFQPFYDDKLREMERLGRLDRARQAGWSVELPVTICWTPPTADGKATPPVQMARKLFVDVNQSARAMGRSRSLLLADHVITGEFMRAFLEACRGNDWPLPLDAVDYEEPTSGRQRAQPRWNAITSLKHLEQMFVLATQGPATVATRVDANFGGAGKSERRRERLLEMIDADQLPYDTAIINNAVTVAEIPSGNGDFAEEVICTHAELRRQLGKRFVSTWGRAIATLFAKAPPYVQQVEALEWLREQVNRAPKADFSTTVREALFDGSGLYYVLENANASHSAKAPVAKGRPVIRRVPAERLLEETESRVRGAWEELEEWRDHYQERLAEIVPGASGAGPKAYWNREKTLLQNSRWYAPQFGLVLTLTALAHKCETKPDDVPKLAEKLAEGLRLAAELKSPRGELLRYVLLRRDDAPGSALNRLEGLEPPLSIHYRYLWLELLHAAPASFWASQPFGEDSRATVRQLASKALVKYRDQCLKDKERHLARQQGKDDPAGLRADAMRLVDGELKEALAAWFGWTEHDYQLWKNEHKR